MTPKDCHMRLHTWLLFLLPLPELAAQLAGPGAHWGTSIYAVAHAEERFSLETYRFTQFSSTGSQHPSQIQETAGINLSKLSITREMMIDRKNRLTWTLEGGVGLSNDQPSEWLQNDYLHAIRHLDKVPVGQRRNATEFVAAGALNYWIGTQEPHKPHDSGQDTAWRYEAFAGAGLATGTLYSESFAHAGGALWQRDANTRVSLLARTSWPDGGQAYPRTANWNNLVQLGVSYVPSDYYLGADGTARTITGELFQRKNLNPLNWPSALHTLIGRPECGLYFTWDSGFFATPAGSEIDTQFISLRFDWPTGMRMETFNDMLNGTDYGPSFGMLVSWDLATFWRTQ